MKINLKFYIMAWIAVVVLILLAYVTDRTELYIVSTFLGFFQLYVLAIVIITKSLSSK